RTSGNEFGRLSNPTFGRLYTCCHPHPRGNTCHQVSAIPPRLVVAGDPTFGSHGQTGAPSLRSSLPSTNFGPLKLERLNRRSESSSIIINHRDPPEESHASSLFPPESFPATKTKDRRRRICDSLRLSEILFRTLKSSPRHLFSHRVVTLVRHQPSY
ncbi:hypothetical protein HID58_002631, partial [Brassica napus]